MDASVYVPDIEEIHKYQYILSEPKENDSFSNKLLYSVFGDRALEMEYEDCLYPDEWCHCMGRARVYA